MRTGILMATGWSFLTLCASASRAGDPAPPTEANVAPAPTGAEIYVYPAKGQNDRQLDRDRYECHNWAMKQTGFDPSEPHLAPHQQVQVVPMPPDHRGAVAGAVTGAVIGASVAHPHDSAEGAIVGAVAGAMVGAASDVSRQQEAHATQTQMSANEQAERARFEKQAYEYRRAISACLEGRGYTVK
jgi:hypothetical protein